MKKSKKEVQPNWHPNFRIQSELPDIKPIRTGFLINFVAVVACAVLAVVLVQQELRRISLGNSIELLETVVNETRADNAASLRDSGRFAELVKHLQELEGFYEAPVIAYELLLLLAEVRPDDLIYDSINYAEVTRMERRTAVTTYRLQITGKSRSLAVLGDFKSRFEGLELVTANDGSVNETILPRDDATGVFPFEMVVNLNP